MNEVFDVYFSFTVCGAMGVVAEDMPGASKRCNERIRTLIERAYAERGIVSSIDCRAYPHDENQLKKHQEVLLSIKADE